MFKMFLLIIIISIPVLTYSVVNFENRTLIARHGATDSDPIVQSNAPVAWYTLYTL